MEKEIEKALFMRARAKQLEDEADMLKKEANDIILTFLPALGLESYIVPGIGSVRVSISRGSSLNKTKLIEGMLKLNLDSDTIVQTIQAASSEWEKEVVIFRPDKK